MVRRFAVSGGSAKAKSKAVPHADAQWKETAPKAKSKAVPRMRRQLLQCSFTDKRVNSSRMRGDLARGPL